LRSWSEIPFVLVSTLKHIVAEMHEAFAHLVDILVAGEFPLQKNQYSEFKFLPFFIIILPKIKLHSKELSYSIWTFTASCDRKIITQGNDYHSIKA
jgi:hypothetical protein